MKDLNIEFPLDNFEKLINKVGWENFDEWFDFWETKKDILSISRRLCRPLDSL